jgi:GGDEF domain-containing protein
MPIVYFHFVLLLTKTKSLIKWVVLKTAYLIGFIIITTIPTNLFNKGLSLEYWGYSPIRGFTGNIYDFMYPLLILLAIYQLLTSLRVSTGRQRSQIQYGIAASLAGFGLGITNFLPLYGIRIYPLGHIGSLIASCLLAYSIVKHKFLDIRIIIRKALIYTIMTLGLTFVYLSIVFMSGEIMGTINQSQRLLMTISFIFIVALLFEPLRGSVQSVIDRLFFKDIYDRRMAMTEFSSSIVKTLDVEDLLDRTLQILSMTFRVSSAFVMLYDNDRNDYALKSFIGWEREELMECYPKADSFIDSLSNNQVIRNKTSGKYSYGDEYSRRALRRLGAEVAIALQTKNRLIGFVCLKERLPSNYDASDIEAIRALTDQLSLAIDNADFYHKNEQKSQYVFDSDYFQKRLDAEIERSRQHKMPVSVLYISLNGQDLDNKAIMKATVSIKSKIRSFDVAGRLTRNMFGLILPGAGQAEVRCLISRLEPELNTIGTVDYDVIERFN